MLQQLLSWQAMDKMQELLKNNPETTLNWHSKLRTKVLRMSKVNCFKTKKGAGTSTCHCWADYGGRRFIWQWRDKQGAEGTIGDGGEQSEVEVAIWSLKGNLGIR